MRETVDDHLEDPHVEAIDCVLSSRNTSPWQVELVLDLLHSWSLVDRFYEDCCWQQTVLFELRSRIDRLEELLRLRGSLRSRPHLAWLLTL
jgi:hypothetical protein